MSARLFLVALLLSVPAVPSTLFPERFRNERLGTRLSETGEPTLLNNATVSLASDIKGFYRVPASVGQSGGYYHGGYWWNALLELRPFEKFSANGRLIFYNPAGSYGVVSPFAFHPLVSLAWEDTFDRYGVPGTRFSARALDLDRQSIGAGLTLSDKEMTGLLLDLSIDFLRFRYTFNATGGYNYGGDLHWLQLDAMEQLLGVYFFSIGVGQHDFAGIFSTHEIFDKLSYRVEAAVRNTAVAGLAGLEIGEVGNEHWGMKLDYQFRIYGNGFAHGIRQAVEHDYLSIDQEDKPFTDSMNLFVINDNVQSHSARLRFKWRPTSWIYLASDNEFARYSYAANGTENHYLFKQEVGICPGGLRGCAAFVFGNKISNAFDPVSVSDRDNKRSFRVSRYLGLEANMRF